MTEKQLILNNQISCYNTYWKIFNPGDAYIITYDLFTSMSPDEGPYSVVEVTIAESGNKYGYSLVSVDVIKELIKGVDDSVRNEM